MKCVTKHFTIILFNLLEFRFIKYKYKCLEYDSRHDCSKGHRVYHYPHHSSMYFLIRSSRMYLSSLGSGVAYAAIAPSSSPPPHQHSFFFLSHCIPSSEHEVLLPGICICISLLPDNMEHLVTNIVVCISSLEKYPLEYFTYFYVGYTMV
jgi:hypothetical protein